MFDAWHIIGAREILASVSSESEEWEREKYGATYPLNLLTDMKHLSCPHCVITRGKWQERPSVIFTEYSAWLLPGYLWVNPQIPVPDALGLWVFFLSLFLAVARGGEMEGIGGWRMLVQFIAYSRGFPAWHTPEAPGDLIKDRLLGPTSKSLIQ